MKPSKPCKHPGCPELTDKSYCSQHIKIYEKQRGCPSERGYDRRWKAIRKRYLIAYPLCFECMRTGVLEPATEVHHIVPLRDGGSSDYSNLMALCKSCHSKYTAKDGGFGRNIVYRY